MTLTRIERFEIGIYQHGYDSDFRKEIEAVVHEVPINAEDIDKVLDKYNIPREK